MSEASNLKNVSSRIDHHYRKREAEKLDAYGVAMTIDPVETPEEFILRQERADVMRKLMLGLPARVERVLRLRWFEGLTLEEAGQDLNVTRERIRQIEAKGMRILRRRLRHEFPAEFKRANTVEVRAIIERQEQQAKAAEEASEARKASEAQEAEQRERDYLKRVRSVEAARRKVLDDFVIEAQANYYVMRDRFLSRAGMPDEQLAYREYIAAVHLRTEAERAYRRGGQ